jgi:GT2 family glycosyltransferase
MDERFFVYFEEVDLCRRMAEAGYEIWFLPEARISHAAGTSCETGSAAAAMIVQTAQKPDALFSQALRAGGHGGRRRPHHPGRRGQAAVLLALYAARGQRRHLEKAKGFWRVAACPGSWR